MGLSTSTLLLSAVMLLGCALPIVSSWARRHSRICLLFGTGALLGLCVFAILPEIVETGGLHTLWLVAIAGAVYSWFHLHHVGHHHHDHGHGEAGHHCGSETKVAVNVLLASMAFHCLADGVVLAVSFTVSAHMARAVLFALLAHKFYEAFNVAALLHEKARSRAHLFGMLAIYTGALPVGVVAGYLVPTGLDRAPVIIMSIALGGLLGCLYHDFLMPSLHSLRQRRTEVGWLIAGFIFSSLLKGGI